MQTTYAYVPRKTNHTLHLVLFLVTFGAWWPVWLGVFLYNELSGPKIQMSQTVQNPVFPMPGYYVAQDGLWHPWDGQRWIN